MGKMLERAVVYGSVQWSCCWTVVHTCRSENSADWARVGDLRTAGADWAGNGTGSGG